MGLLLKKIKNKLEIFTVSKTLLCIWGLEYVRHILVRYKVTRANQNIYRYICFRLSIDKSQIKILSPFDLTS